MFVRSCLIWLIWGLLVHGCEPGSSVRSASHAAKRPEQTRLAGPELSGGAGTHLRLGKVRTGG
jgi:hypothetical protein